jgi:hypothetical protein
MADDKLIQSDDSNPSADYSKFADEAFGTDNKDHPSSSGMVSPQARKGDLLVGKTQVRMAMNVLGQALTKLGTDTPEGKRVLSTLNSLSHEFGDIVSNDLVPSQILELVRGEASLQKGQPITDASTAQAAQQQPKQQPGGEQSAQMLQQLAQQLKSR